MEDKKRLLEDYRFDDSLWYEAHTLHYMQPDGVEILFGGIMGAAVICALLADTDEGDARGITVDGEAQREQLFLRYEREVRRDNGGLFSTEVEALSQAYMELAGSEQVLPTICRNDRLCDLAIGLVMDYMKRLIVERAGAHIYDVVAWRMPFAQWLFDAGFAETHRRRLLSIDCSDAAQVYALAQSSQVPQDDEPVSPTFYFEGEKADELMNMYFQWLWTQVQAEASMMPDAQVQLAELRSYVLGQETDYSFLNSELKALAPEERNLFHKWMTQWTDFITRKLSDTPENTFPTQTKQTKFKQELFPDNIMPCPPENNYVSVCDYIAERCRYDEVFRAYCESRTRVDFCKQLTAMFGWVVDSNHLGKRLKSHKRKKSS